MPFCTNCGKKLKEDAIRCIHCGQYRSVPDNGTIPSVGGQNPHLNERPFHYSVFFYLVIIVDILVSLALGWAFLAVYFDVSSTGYQNLLALLWGLVLVGNFIIDILLLKGTRNSPQKINKNLCMIKCLAGFFGIFTIISSLYFLIISIMTSQSPHPVERSPSVENSYAKYWYNKGVDFSNAQDYKSAISSYNQALAIDDKDPDIWNNMCFALLKQGWYEQAISAGTVGTNLAPDDPVIWENLRDAYYANNEPAKASECQNKISSLKNGPSGNSVTSDNSGKTICVCCGLVFLFFVVIAIFNNWESVGKNFPNLLYVVIFSILLMGILYEGWKAVSQ